MSLSRRCVLSRKAKADPIEPRFCFFAQGPPQFAKSHIPWRVASHKVDESARIGSVPLELRIAHGEDDVSMCIINREDPFGAYNSYFQTVHRGRPSDGK